MKNLFYDVTNCMLEQALEFAFSSQTCLISGEKIIETIKVLVKELLTLCSRISACVCVGGFSKLHLLVFPIKKNNMASDTYNNLNKKDDYLLHILQKCYLKTIIELLALVATALGS